MLEGLAVPQGSRETLIDLIASLSDEQQSAVEAFIRYLRDKGSPTSKAEVRIALDEFVREHSDLLRRLAQ
jgi:hypothetical protein